MEAKTAVKETARSNKKLVGAILVMLGTLYLLVPALGPATYWGMVVFGFILLLHTPKPKAATEQPEQPEETKQA